jgi:hypothetical protein
LNPQVTATIQSPSRTTITKNQNADHNIKAVHAVATHLKRDRLKEIIERQRRKASEKRLRISHNNYINTYGAHIV